MQKSVDRTTRWLARCKAEMARLNSLPDTINKEQLLFGINQGAVYEDIRIEHAKAISEMDLDGYAVGGLAVGETHEEMYRILDAVVPYLPQNKPTYLMGVGTPANILEGVEERNWNSLTVGIIQPSTASHGHVYTKSMEDESVQMQNMNWTHVLSKKAVSVLHASITAEPISVIF